MTVDAAFFEQRLSKLDSGAFRAFLEMLCAADALRIERWRDHHWRKKPDTPEEHDKRTTLTNTALREFVASAPIEWDYLDLWANAPTADISDRLDAIYDVHPKGRERRRGALPP